MCFKFTQVQNKVLVKMDPKLGWIYAVSCDMYDKEGLIKLGYTEKPHLIEEEVRISLLSRYSTTLVKPYIKALIKVSNPRGAEKDLFKNLINYKHSNEIFKADFNTIILVELNKLKIKFSPDVSYKIDEVVLEKLLCRLRKKSKKIAKDIEYQNIMFYWMENNNKILSDNNRQQLCYFRNNMPGPCIIGSHFDWTKRTENLPILRMREQNVNNVFMIHNWDRNDKELHVYLKRLLDAV